jgi:hypothetical protein
MMRGNDRGGLERDDADGRDGWRPAALSLSLAGALLGAVVLGAQVSGIASPILTGSDKSMDQYEALRATVRRIGDLELVVLGNFTALMDPVRWRGKLRRFLLDHVAAMRLRYRARAALLGEPIPRRAFHGYDGRFGYLPSGTGTRKLEWDRLEWRLKNWSLHETRLSGVEAAVRKARSYGSRVWLVEGPLHPYAIANMIAPEARARVRRALRGLATASGARLLELPDDLTFESSEFVDTGHLSEAGARRYTRWLVEALVPARASASRSSPRSLVGSGDH